MSTLQINKSKHQSLKLAGSNFVIPLMATVGLFAGGVAFLNPLSFIDNSYADSTNTDISINIGETIMLPELSQEAINLNLEPNVDGDFTSASVNVHMSTNHVSGYTLTMSTEGTETALTSSDFDSYKIDALGSKTSATNFTDLTHADSINKWGYATDNNGTSEGQTEENYYYGITNKDNPTTIKITDGPTNGSETNVTFATKGKDLAAGTYSNTVVFSAVANTSPGSYYMQDFTTEKCNTLTEWKADGTKGNTITLVDSRDGSEYSVRKLADGHCWMTQDLRIIGPKTLTSKNSNFGDSITDYSFNLPAPTTVDEMPYNSDTAKTAHLSYSKEVNQEVLYNWYTATAGFGIYGKTTQYANIEGSICPKNWELPSRAEDGDPVKGQDTTLYAAYGGTGTTTDSSSSLPILQQAFTPSYAGLYIADKHYGSISYLWSRTPQNSTGAYSLHLTTSGSVTLAGAYQYDGRSVRCVFVGS